MSLHKSPETPSERLVLHLETNYGVQLDPARYRQLVSEIDEHISAAMARFANAVSPSPGPLMAPLENLNVGSFTDGA